MTDKTLAEKVKNILTSFESPCRDIEKKFSEVKLNGIAAKSPKLKKLNKAKKQDVKKLAREISLPNAKEEKIPISSIVSILIKNAVEEAKKQAKPVFSSDTQEDKSYTLLKEDKDKNIGGYGAISKNYGGGAAPSVSYIDYKNLFSYLGKLRSQSSYENFDSNNSAGGNSSDDGKFLLIEAETMEKGAKFVRYFSNPGLDIYSATLSAVPFGGMSGAEWEQFKLLMQLDKVMYRLKTSSS